MANFVKLTMDDNGRPIHFNVDQVEQIRMAADGDATAIHLAGKSNPIMVSEKMEAVMKKLAAAGSPRAA